MDMQQADDQLEQEISVGIVGDTHGFLSEALLAELKKNDYLVHAGDICSPSNLDELNRLAPIYACLGNNDYCYTYGPQVKKITRFSIGGLRWMVCHYREMLEPETCDVAICGHTHRPYIENDPSGCLIMNPGSPTYPRTAMGPSCGRIVLRGKKIISSDIILLDE